VTDGRTDRRTGTLITASTGLCEDMALLNGLQGLRLGDVKDLTVKHVTKWITVKRGSLVVHGQR